MELTAKNHERLRISISRLADSIFFLYLCTILAHNGEAGTDYWIRQVIVSILTLVGVIEIIADKGKLRILWPTVPFILFYLFYFLSITWGDFEDGTYYTAAFLKQIFVLLFLSQNVDSQDKAKKYMRYFLWAVLYTVIRLVAMTPIAAWGTERLGYGVGLNPNTLGEYLALGVVLSLFYGEEKRFYYWIAALFVILSLLTGSRTNFFGIFLALFLYFYGRSRGKKKIVYIFASIGILIALFYVTMNNEMLYSLIGNRIDRFFYSLGGFSFGRLERVTDTSISQRDFFRQYAFQMFLNRPLLGYGANGFYTEMGRINYSHVTYSHCNYTELLATTGIVGFSLYYSGFLIPLFKGRRAIKRNKDRILKCAVLSIVVSLLMQYATVPYVQPFLQCYISLCAIYISCESKKRKAVSHSA